MRDSEAIKWCMVLQLQSCTHGSRVRCWCIHSADDELETIATVIALGCAWSKLLLYGVTRTRVW